MWLRMHAKLLARRFRKVYAVIVRRFFDVGEGERAFFIRDAHDLIEPSDGVAHVLRVGQRLLALLRKSEDAVGQIALRRKIAVLFMRFPSGFHFFDHSVSSMD